MASEAGQHIADAQDLALAIKKILVDMHFVGEKKVFYSSVGMFSFTLGTYCYYW